ncbi:MAG: hypothetical protein EXS64_06670 [Candidatus Latescibacteria bacterium]|nr:hypothetical protein [Candidatus Latescibacterota bacterium]
MDGRDFIGESKAIKGSTELSWRLVPAGNATNSWLQVGDETPDGYYVLCINTRAKKPFKQQVPTGATPIKFRGHETLLGLTNPGTKQRGFKACVTADYDLFAIWPKTGKPDLMSARHNLNAQLLKKFSSSSSLASGVARMSGIDDRLQSQGHREHHRFGDVSTRVMLIKTMLNSALMGASGYSGGNAIHHNDEAGNFALAKGSLADCFPLICFMPQHGTVLIENLPDFKELVIAARTGGFQERAKQQWLRDAGIES